MVGGVDDLAARVYSDNYHGSLSRPLEEGSESNLLGQIDIRYVVRTKMKPEKPLGIKAYGSIGHLPDSRMGPGDHKVAEGQARICCQKARDRHDRIIVTEKLDGSCTAVAKVEGNIVALGRAGYRAETSPYEQHKLFAQWVYAQWGRFDAVLLEGQRLVGEWLAQAHGTRYKLGHEPWVCFDLMDGHDRVPYDEFKNTVTTGVFVSPYVVSDGPPKGSTEVMSVVGPEGFHGAIEPIEGAVWRVERRGKFDYLAKWVRPDKVDGIYLPEQSGKDAIWHWKSN